MNAPAKAVDLDYEGVFALLDTWLRASESCREVKLRPVLRGLVCTLYSGGNPVAQGMGGHSDEAIANALEMLS